MTVMKRLRQGFTLVEIMIVIVIIGLLAAMAIPAVKKIQTNAQDKKVMSNARQLAAAADQYYLENGVSTVTYGALVGPKSYIKSLSKVAGETYPTVFKQGEPIVITGVGGSRTLTYTP